MAAQGEFAEKLRSIQFAGAMRKPQVYIDNERDNAPNTKSVEVLDEKGRSAGAYIHHGDGMVDAHVVVHDPVQIDGGF